RDTHDPVEDRVFGMQMQMNEWYVRPFHQGSLNAKGPEASAMLLAGAVAQNALAMLDGGVTFVATKPVVGIDPVERDHHPVPMNLGEDGCRADRGHLVITAYDRVTVHLPVVEHEIRQPVAVHLDGAGTDTEAQDRTAHREKGCLQNVDPVDFRRVSPCYRP